MEQLLKKLKIIDFLQFELDIQLEDFVEKLNSTVDKEKTGAFRNYDEYYSKSKSIYIGEVDHTGFWIRAAKRKRKFFKLSKDLNLGYAEGTFEQKGSKLIITAKLKGYSRRISYYIKLIGIFYLVSFILFLVAPFFHTGIIPVSLFFPIMMLFQIGMIGVISIFFMRDFTAVMIESLPQQFLEISRT